MIGLSDDEIAAIAAHLSGTDGSGSGAGVWPQNIPAVSAFVAVATQWRTALAPTENGLRVLWIGLDYAAVRAGLELARITVTPETWAGLVDVELAARDALNGVSG